METKRRLLSLDIFRGITIAGMMLVNNPGTWSDVYSPLLHAEWHGCTPTDLVFPFFLFIMGVAVPLALTRRKESGSSLRDLYLKIGRRTLLLFAWGLFLAAFPRFGMKDAPAGITTAHYLLLTLFLASVFFREAEEESAGARRRRIWNGLIAVSAVGMVIIGIMYYDFSSLRIPGVLQRIALVYGICAILFLKFDARGLFYIGAGALLLYWLLMTLIPVPGVGYANLEPDTNLGAWLDYLLLKGHLYSQTKVWDPEGLLSTLPAVGTGIAGMLTGIWLRSPRNDHQKLTALMSIGAILVFLGLFWDLAFPINKKIWTSSYVLYHSGIAMLMLGVIYWLVDVLHYKFWIQPFVIYGRNALALYIAAGLLTKTLFRIQMTNAAGESQNLYSWIFQNFFNSWLPTIDASFAFAFTYVLVMLLLGWLLYRRGVFIKV